jgi:undecaprenyl-diphosphatase
MVTSSRLVRRLGEGRAGRALQRVADRSGLPAAVVLVVALAAVGIAALGLAFAAILDAVREGDDIAAFDPRIHRWVVDHRTANLDHFFRGVTWAGSMTVLLPLVLGTIALLVWRRHPALALAVAIATGGSLLTVGIMKAVVGRSRPPVADRIANAYGAAFPSGHSANVVAACGILAWVATRFVHRTWLRAAIWTVAAVVALLVGVSRVYLGVHWPSDVLSGWIVGAAWVVAAIAITALIPALEYRRRTRHDARPDPRPDHPSGER